MAGNDVLAKKYIEFAQKGMGSITKHLQNLQAQMTQAKGRATLLQRHLQSGVYQKHANQLAAINRQYAAMMKSARLADLVAEHGKFGGQLKYLEERMGGVTRAAGIGFGVLTATTMGWVTAGMAGTVEAARMQNAFWLLSHGIAGVFKPTMDDATKLVYRAAYWFRGLSESQQETLRTTVLWTAGLLGGVIAINLGVKALVALRAGLVATGAVMRATALSAGALFGGVGFRALLGLGAVGVGLYALNEATKGPNPESHPADRDVATKLTDTAGRSLGGLWDNTIGRLYKDSDEISKRNRRRFLEEREQWDMLKDPEKAELKKLREEDKKKRTEVTPFTPGFSEIGSAWDRASNAILQLDDPALRTANATESMAVLLRQVAEDLARRARPDTPEKPV